MFVFVFSVTNIVSVVFICHTLSFYCGSKIFSKDVKLRGVFFGSLFFCIACGVLCDPVHVHHRQDLPETQYQQVARNDKPAEEPCGQEFATEPKKIALPAPAPRENWIQEGRYLRHCPNCPVPLPTSGKVFGRVFASSLPLFEYSVANFLSFNGWLLPSVSQIK